MISRDVKQARAFREQELERILFDLRDNPDKYKEPRYFTSLMMSIIGLYEESTDD